MNKKEYEILKSLDSKWKRIARDERHNDVCIHSLKPIKEEYGWTNINSEYNFLDARYFQFIQWEDEKPYNIQDLIDEYEREYHIENAKIVNIDADKITGSVHQFNESEETEVKKDKKWLVDKWTKERNGIDVYDPMYQFISEFIADVNQLDEPEVTELDALNRLAQNMPFSADEIARHLEKLSAYHGHGIKLVPKQELPVVPQFVAEWYESEGKRSDWWNWFYKWGRDESSTDLEAKTIRWMQDFNEELFVDMFRYGYEVKTEQKYYVINNDQRMMLARMMDGKTITEADPFKLEDMYEGEKIAHRLTEQEIKDYDERYIPFMVPVDEVNND